MADSILHNSAALQALKRHQLVSLSKKYGLKASGKNVDMIERLETYATTMTTPNDFMIPSPEPTPAPQRTMPSFSATSEQYTPINQLYPNNSRYPAFDFNMHQPPPAVPTPGLTLAPIPGHLNHKASNISMMSDSWEVLSESGASMISPTREPDYGSVRSWKSAGNGESLMEFGELPQGQEEPVRSSRSRGSRRSSVFALATSLGRSASRNMLHRAQPDMDTDMEAYATQPERPATPEHAEVMQPLAPSPASTVGVARRYSKVTLLERPSTLRLCSPTPHTPGKITPQPTGLTDGGEEDDLPFVNSAQKMQFVKTRRSAGPRPRTPSSIRKSLGKARKSMPATATLSQPTTPAHGRTATSLYPPLPLPVPSFRADTDAPPVPPVTMPMPGAWLGTSNKSSVPPNAPFTFGTGSHGVSTEQFSSAAQAILQQMNAKLPEDARMDGEILKGKMANLDRTTSVNKDLGAGNSWGLGTFGGREKKDRYAEAHEKEFSRMKSIARLDKANSSSKAQAQFQAKDEMSGGANKNIMTPGKKRKLSGGDDRHQSTERKVSANAHLPSAPNGEPLAKRTRLSQGPSRTLGSLRDAGRSVMTLLGDGGEEKEKTASNGVVTMNQTPIRKKKGSIRQRLSLLRPFKRATQPKRLSNHGMHAPAVPTRRLSIDKKARAAHVGSSAAANLADARAQKKRMPSTSATTVLSTSSTLPPRLPIPDFGDAVNSATGLRSSTNSTSAAGQSTTNSKGSVNRHTRHTQADVIKKARPAPAPPAPSSAFARPLPAPPAGTLTAIAAQTRTAGNKRSSRLMQPTAASLARMQATVKPTLSTSTSFGNGIGVGASSAAPPSSSSFRSPAGPTTSSRPLPHPPTAFNPRAIVTSNPFGKGESRENLFQENFHPPHTPPVPFGLSGFASPSASASIGALSPPTRTPSKRTPMKPKSSSRLAVRHKSSGLDAIKSKSKSRGDIKVDVEVQRKRAEVRGRNERRVEERELREMLGGMDGNQG